MKDIDKSKWIKFFIVLAVILLLIFFNFRGLLSAPKSWALFAASPFLKLFQVMDKGVSGSWAFFLAIKDLNKENAGLKSENQFLFEEVTRLKEVARENELLRQQIGIGQAEQQRLVMAEVIGYNPTLGQYILIDKGAKDGITVDLAVVAANNFLVGRVAEVNANFSKVLLISDSDSLVNAITQDTRISGVVKGNHGLGVLMEMIPIDAQVAVGETVLTSGLNETIAKNLIVGRVEEVIKKESDIFQSATIKAAVEFDKLEQVFILFP
ncbi:MAG TPA: rod shape-determining protein MreC [Candidatus Portnoybacteria bacterium]|nr:rod shape-determining protein MreC [Candidatus Portnoybacteria bacterium]